MEAIKPGTPAIKRVLPTHELNARRRRKRAVLPNVPSPATPMKQSNTAAVERDKRAL